VETFATNGLLRLPRMAPSVATQILTGSPPPPCRKRSGFTRGRSLVRSQVRPPRKALETGPFRFRS
jgi:hypothetical protein